MRWGRWVMLRVTWLLCWLGLWLQWWVTLGLVRSQGRGVAAAAVVFLSYFTVLTNLLAAGVLTAEVMGWWVGRRWWPSAVSAVAMYLGVVCAVYFLLLSDVWEPTGAQWVANGLLHYVTPVLYAVWWWVFVGKGRVGWRAAGWWMVYPAVYVAGMLVRGSAAGVYPYWFVDVRVLGWGRVLLNWAGFTLVFLLAGLGVIGVDRWLGRRGRQREAG